MRSARVDIRITRAGPERLQAQCTATFELENVATGGAPTEFMVAFPVTGLAEATVETGAVHVEEFSVSVDGNSPPTVRRDTVYVGYYRGRHYGPRDTPVNGKLEGRFGPPPLAGGSVMVATIAGPDAKAVSAPQLIYAGCDPAEKPEWTGIALADRSKYRAAYLWTQKLAPGGHQEVVVSYRLALRPQAIRYSGPDENGEEFAEWTIPQKKISSLNRDQRYYFFDYVLKSGATWDGPIGRETITVSSGDGVDLGRLVSFGRPSVSSGSAWVWEIVNEKPTDDVLVALPF
jgi:hypothetical protein